MKTLAAATTLLGLAAAVACGDSSATTGGGGTAGAASTAGAAQGGSPSQGGGSSEGGTDQGGQSTGGTAEGGGVPDTDPCADAADGAHCGSELGGLADHGSLYHCQSGVTQSVDACPAGCEGSACITPAADPCESAQFGNGDYCGGSLIGGDAEKLYHCADGSTQSAEVCEAGCQVQPPGVPDTCKPTGDPCALASSGNGLYCAASLGAGDPNVLYDCENGATASTTQCTQGCQPMPPGQPDQCATGGGGGCCVNAPPGALTQAYSACGLGGSHYGRDYGTAIGTPIYAGISGTVVGSALGFPNCYDNGCTSQCWNAFNYVKIKSDCGDPDDPAHDLFVYYLHIDSLAPSIGNGSHVTQGQLVAYSGNSGCSSGPHIHIETVSVPAGQSAGLSTCNSVDPASRYCP